MIFEVQNGSFGYGKEKNIIENISFRIGEGSILSILGSNGIGKTTVLKCMMGFLKWRCGKSLLNGQDINSIPVKKLWQQIAYVPQAKGSTFSFTGLEMVLIGRSPHLGAFAQPGGKDVFLAQNALREVGAYYLKDRLCSQMSGGELQLVLIARSLAGNPKLLILDEPESGLDFKNQLIILELIKSLTREKKLSVVINTHYPMHALQISDYTLILNKGCGYVYGDTKRIINEENMRAAFDVNVFIDTIEVNNVEYNDIIPLSLVNN